MSKLTIKAPAKINLCLKLLGERPDGFTDIWSVVQAVSLFDEIDIEKKECGLALSSNDSSIPLDGSNTVAKAWAAMCQVLGTELGAKIHIGKRIPAQSGLGGGSSDAAAVLIGLRQLYDIQIDMATLAKIGAAVGSDVPLFLGTGTSIITGRGENVRNIQLDQNYSLLIVKPHYGMSTARAYNIAKKGLTKGRTGNIIARLQPPVSAIEACRIGNDLEPVFLNEYPGAAEIKKKLRSMGAEHSALTGSGSAFYGFFSDEKSGIKAEETFDNMWCQTASPISLCELHEGIID